MSNCDFINDSASLWSTFVVFFELLTENADYGSDIQIRNSILGILHCFLVSNKVQFSPATNNKRVGRLSSKPQLGQVFSRCIKTFENICRGRECIRTGAAGARTRRSLGHHLLHPLILRLLVLCAPADFETQSSPGCTCTCRSRFLTHSLVPHHATYLVIMTLDTGAFSDIISPKVIKKTFKIFFTRLNFRLNYRQKRVSNFF